MLRKVFSKQFLIFGLVGIANTLIDLGLFTLLYHSGLPILLANIISTSAALVASFILNSRLTFKDTALSRQRIVKFLAVTLTGLWILQPIVISGALYIFEHTPLVTDIVEIFVKPASSAFPTLAKLLSISVTLVWNFIWYKLVVFADQKD